MEKDGYMQLTVNIALNLGLCVAIFIVTYYLIIFYKIKKPEPLFFKLFIVTFILGGFSRLVRALAYIFDSHVEEFMTFVDLVLLIVINFGILALPTTMRRILSFKTPEEYEILNRELKTELLNERVALQGVREVNHKLGDRLQTIENTIYNQGWISEQQLKLKELRDIVTELREKYK